MNSDDLTFSPACERNKRPILEVLKQVLPAQGTVLEIGSCTGQHVVFFAPQFPHLHWQPSDRPENLPGLRSRLETEGIDTILSPIMLDVLESWPEKDYAAVYSANTAHIMSWSAVCAMLSGVAQRLVPGGVFCLYGPFNEQGRFTAASNAVFDAQLRRENPEMGLRDLEALESLATDQHMTLKQRVHLPANNQMLVFMQEIAA